MQLQKQDLLVVKGGGFWSATMITTFLRGYQFIYQLGQSIGSAIYRNMTKRYC